MGEDRVKFEGGRDLGQVYVLGRCRLDNSAADFATDSATGYVCRGN